MSVFRIYPEKSNTLASGVYKNLNSGQNAITDIWHGGGDTDSAIIKRNSISRFIMKFDLNELSSLFIDKTINKDRVTSYKLKIKNSIPREVILEDDYEYDRLSKKIAASFDLIAFPINKDWDEGRGYDLFKENYIAKQYGNPIMSGYSNWNSATSTVNWDEPGIFSDPSTAVTNIASQHFDIGDENIDMDITSIVNDWISGGSQNNGIAIAFRRDYELLSSDTRYITSFFTEKTNSSYKPYIEVNYSQTFEDDRMQVSNNRPSRLFLYTFSGNNFVNYTTGGNVDIIDSSGNVVHSGLVPNHLEKGIYYVDAFMSGTTRGQQFKDVWKSVSFKPGYDLQDFTQIFTIKDSYYNGFPQANQYSITTYGIEDGSIITSSEIHKVFVDVRVNYSNRKQPSTAYKLRYKMIMNNQDEVIPWTDVNQAVINKCKTNYFTINTSWLLHNQSYEIHYKIEEMGTSRVLPKKTSFRIIRPSDF